MNFVQITLFYFKLNCSVYLFQVALDLCYCTAFFQLWQAGATLWLWCESFSLWWFLLRQSTGSRAHGFCGCSAWAQLPRSMWDLSGPGVKSVSPGSNLLLEDLLEEDIATYSSILARIPRTQEPGGLQSMGSQRVGHDSSDLACTEARMTSHSSRYQNFFCYTRYWCPKARSQHNVVWGVM